MKFVKKAHKNEQTVEAYGLTRAYCQCHTCYCDCHGSLGTQMGVPYGSQSVSADKVAAGGI